MLRVVGGGIAKIQDDNHMGADDYAGMPKPAVRTADPDAVRPDCLTPRQIEHRRQPVCMRSV